MNEEYHETTADASATSELVSDLSLIIPIKSSPSSAEATSPPLESPPRLIPQSSEATVTFPSSCSTSESYSTNYANQSIDLTTFATGDASTSLVSTENSDSRAVHRCTSCGDSFATSYDLAVHWQEAHRESYKCKRCDRCFTKKYNFQRHNCINTCNICSQQFTRRYNLKLHMQIHGDGSNLYKCEYCGKSFTRRYTLLTHIRSHSGIKLFKCSICTKAFTRQHTLNLHLKRHITKANFFCRKCSAVFTDAVSLQAHLETEHTKAKKGKTMQGSTAQTNSSSSNVIFPNSSSGYMYGTENIGPPLSYHMSPYYQHGPSNENTRLQNTYRGEGPGSLNLHQSSFDSRENSMTEETAIQPVALDKLNWFDDQNHRRDPLPMHANPPALERESDLNRMQDANIVTVLDSEEEKREERSMFSNESSDVTNESRNHEMGVNQDRDATEGITLSQDTDPAKMMDETRRSLFPMNNTKRSKRMTRATPRPVHPSWKRNDRMVKETSEIRIDIVDPNSFEGINPLLTPPRSSNTSTPGQNQASSESGSPGAASFMEMSPANSSYSKLSQSTVGSSAKEKPSPTQKTCLLVPKSEDHEYSPQHQSTQHEHAVPPRSRAISYNSSPEIPPYSKPPPQAQNAVNCSRMTPNDNENWRCDHCAVTFEDSLMYVVHMGCHGQADPFQCSMCGIICQDRMAFTLHIIGGKHNRPKQP